ncbi:putative short-chain dehydrogenase [Nemania sp. NC0429]|nr:putative short-chain dehydrogenase [Nemania sp. NC0429]
MSSSPFNPYASQHKDTNGPGDSRPTAMQILEDNKLVGAWPGKVVLITGATSGIGIETARAMYATGAQVYLVARNTAKAQPIVADIINTTKGTGKIEVIDMDLDSLDSVKNAAQEFLKRSPKLNVLINNAGVMACPKTITVDGFERQFAVNYLAHFTLTTLLLPALLAGSSPAFNSRVVWVSSGGHRFSPLNLDLKALLEDYNPQIAYGQSKTAMIWGSNHLDRLYGPRGVHSLAIHPGGIFTNLTQYMTEAQINAYKDNKDAMKKMKSPEQGAATQVWAAVAPVWEGKGGKYLEDVSLAEPAAATSGLLIPGYSPHAYDPANEEKLWKLSLELTNIESP